MPEPVGRHYFDFQTRITGPVFNRIWNRPGGGYAEKIKHVIEPTFSIQRVTAIDTVDQIVKLEGTDYERGNVTRYTYGLSNRLYAKKDQLARDPERRRSPRATTPMPDAAQYDRQLPEQLQLAQDADALLPRRAAGAHLARPTAMQARVPHRVRHHGAGADDACRLGHRSTAATGSPTSAGWSHRRFIRDLPASTIRSAPITTSTRPSTCAALATGSAASYTFNYDLLRDNFLQQRYIAYYNAQCCGIGFEYQSFNFQNAAVGLGVPKDRRFNISFTLAGIGTFSNLFGAFGGQTR